MQPTLLQRLSTSVHDLAPGSETTPLRLFLGLLGFRVSDGRPALQPLCATLAGVSPDALESIARKPALSSLLHEIPTADGPLANARLVANAAQHVLQAGELDPDANWRGAVYTPDGLARAAVRASTIRSQETPAPHRRVPAVLDPCVGAGSLLLAFVEEAVSGGTHSAGPADLTMSAGDAVACCHGVDIQPVAIHTTRLVLAIAAGDGFDSALAATLQRQLAVADSLGGGPDVAIQRIGEAVSHPGGWDLVIANPPYQRAARRQAAALRADYKTPFGAFDLYVPFVELGLALLHEGGTAAFITSNKYLVADYGKKLRQLLMERAQLHLVFDLTEALPFEALVDPVLTVFSQRPMKSGLTTSATALACATGELQSLPETVDQVLHLQPGEFAASDVLRAERVDSSAADGPSKHLPWKHLEHAADGPWPIRCLGNVRRTAAAMAAAGPPLAECFDVRTGVMGFNYRAALAALREYCPDETRTDKAKAAPARRAVSPGLVGTLRCLWGETEVRLGGELRRYPILVEPPGRMSAETWAWLARPKVLIPGVASELRAFFDQRGEYAPLVAVHGVSGEAMAGDVGRGLAVFLCSAPVRWWFRARWEGARIPRGSRRFGVGMLSTIPVPGTVDQLAELASYGPGELDEASKIVARMFDIELEELGAI